MASEKINVKIEADYDDREAKQAIKDAERLDGTDVEVQIDADATEAVRSIREVDEALEDVPSKADKVAAAIVEMSNKIDAETRDAAAAADMLKVALGDAAERIDATEAVAELRKMGLTADEVRADVDQLADALKHADALELGRAKGELDTLGTAAGSAKTKVGELGDRSDQSRSVLANMAGNAAQDLGELGGVVGTLGVGIGQMAEYATEGNISLNNLAAVAGPMLGLAAATLLVSTAMGGAAKKAKFEGDLVGKFAEGLREGTDAAQTLLDTIRETGQLAFTDVNRGMANLDTATANLIPNLLELGITYDEFIDLVQSGLRGEDLAAEMLDRMSAGAEEAHSEFGVMDDTIMEVADAIGQYADANAAATVTQEQLNEFLAQTASTAGDITAAMSKNTVVVGAADVRWTRLLNDLRDGHIDTVKATEAWNTLRDALQLTDAEMAALTQTKLDERMRAVADAIGEAAAASEDSAESHQAAADALQAEADAANNAADALSEQANAQRRAVDAYYNLRDARQAQVDAIEAVKIAESEHGTESVEYRESLEDVTAAIQDTADAEVRLAQEQAESEGATLSAVDAIDIQNSALIRQASQLRGPSRAAIVQHIAALNGIPPEVISEILALLDQGKVEEAEAKIAELSEPRDLEIKAQVNRAAAAVAEAALNALTAQEEVPIVAELHHQNFDQQMRNLLAVQRFANIVARFVPGGTSAASAAGGRAAPESAAAVTNVTVHVPRGVRPDDMIRAGDRYARRNGHARAHRR